MKLFFYLLLTIVLIACKPATEKGSLQKGKEIQIQWTDNLVGDFSFTNNWTYPEGIYLDEFGQLSCDGICPPETEQMKDQNGRIFKDSLEAFYNVVDTTHQYHSILSEAWCYEWAGTDLITIEKADNKTVDCYTHTNAATHCSLKLKIINGNCYPTIELISISSSNSEIYVCNAGTIQIDQKLWTKDTMKAEFSFTFDHKEDPEKPMYWKGKIYAKIDNNKKH